MGIPLSQFAKPKHLRSDRAGDGLSEKESRLAEKQKMFAFGQTSHCLLCNCRGAGSVVASMPKTFSDWLGRQVVLQIEAEESLVPLRGLIVNESSNALRFRLDGGWEVDIYKEMILRVEADNYEAFQMRNWEANNQALDAVRADSMVMLCGNRAFDRWCGKHISWQLWWRTMLYVGMAGSILFALALRMSVAGPITHFVRFLSGYLGLTFLAVAVGCGVWVLIDSVKTHPHIFAKWSKPFASLVDWFRRPIHL
jgi:hypothetical protein